MLLILAPEANWQEFCTFQCAWLMAPILTFVCILVLHEAAHAAVAWLVGFRVLHVEIGQGPAWRAWHLRSFVIVVRRWPTFGYVSAAWRGRAWLRCRNVAFLLAGPLMNIALAAAAIWLLGFAGDPAQRFLWLPSAAVTVFMAVTGLIPFTMRSPFVFQTDLAKVIGMLRVTAAELDARLAASPRMLCVHDSWMPLLRGDLATAEASLASAMVRDPANWELHATSAILRLSRGDAAGAMAAHEAMTTAQRQWAAGLLSAPGPRTRGEHVLLAKQVRREQVNRAFFLVHLGSPTAVAQARALAEAWYPGAVPNDGDGVATLRTRGLVRLHSGAIARGITDLRRALAVAEPYWLRALGMAYLAYGHALQGEVRAARKWARKARRLHPRNPLLPLRLRLVEEELAKVADRPPQVR